MAFVLFGLITIGVTVVGIRYLRSTFGNKGQLISVLTILCAMPTMLYAYDKFITAPGSIGDAVFFMVLYFSMAFSLALASAVYLAIAYFFLRVAKRSGSQKAVWGVGIAFTAPVLILIWQTVDSCFATPRYVPPACADSNRCGDGQLIFPCDGPLGVITLSFTRFYGPATAVFIGVLTFLVARKTKSQESGIP